MTEEILPADDEESERGEGDSTLPSKADIKLWRRALRENWPISADDRNQIIRDMMDAFIMSESTRDKINAAKVIMLGDSLNVKRASMIGAANKTQQATQVNVTNNNIVQVVESDDWYGTRAAAESRVVATSGNGSPAGNIAVTGEIQSGGVRPPLGQNGNGTNGHH